VVKVNHVSTDNMVRYIPNYSWSGNNYARIFNCGLKKNYENERYTLLNLQSVESKEYYGFRLRLLDFRKIATKIKDLRRKT
jgi:hypothetical protein